VSVCPDRAPSGTRGTDDLETGRPNDHPSVLLAEPTCCVASIGVRTISPTADCVRVHAGGILDWDCLGEELLSLAADSASFP
jgi:hypothetical protein